MSKKVALITGASAGIGKSTAIELHNKGFIVYGAARRKEMMQDLAKLGIRTISLDVTNEESMVSCVNEILKKEGRIDVLVNNAGYGSYGAVEDVPMEEARRQMEVNVFGLARMTQLVLPSMRKHKFGKIINISSMGGKVWTSFGGWYHATKFAVEGFSDCLRLEVEPFGIDVIVIEPGGIATDWGVIAAENLRIASAKGAYMEAANKSADNMVKTYSGSSLTKPEVIARCIGKAATVKKPKTRYLVGFGAKPMVFIKTVFGDRVFDKMIKRFS
ncbi:short-chain dehydrogenase/reductase [Paenibacillus sp. BIHB 4019]|uniref:Short-chain dehydrogenase/reductase n=1 Tax=Paenibacillus sp. BIHB 4019 TaxID=1870819 RepID=A0A1B2DD52_9BACL|nr:oxidoreductase [Paenibacillus sp. BIHB 4019]ANY65633.1 short-chain dehydrogenase/reductase [Paenibacillus sp. BIHB 4019]